MALAIVATPGSASANAFVTVAEVTTYLEGRLNATVWTAAAGQWPAIVEATRDINAFVFVGYKATTTQALQWPREWAVNPDAASVVEAPQVEYFANDEIPQRVKDATCELTLAYLKAGTTDLAVADAGAGVIRKKTDVLETEWASPRERAAGLARFPRVLNALLPLLAGAGSTEMERV